MEVYPKHHRNVVKTITFYIVILLLPIVIMLMFLALNDKFSASDIYNIGKLESGSNWPSVLGSIATIVLAFNVLQWEITKQLEVVFEKMSSKNRDREALLQDLSKIIIYYKIALFIGFAFLFAIAAILISTKGEPSSFLIASFLYCVCSFNVFLMAERIDKASTIVAPPPTGMEIFVETERWVVDRYLSITVMWRFSLFAILFIFYSLQYENLIYILFIIFTVFGTNAFIRTYFTAFTFTPSGFKTPVAVFVALTSSFMSWSIAIMLGFTQKDGEVSYLNNLSLPDFLIVALNSEWFVYPIILLIFILLFFDFLSSQNMFRKDYLRARCMLLFSRNYSILELNIHTVIVIGVSFVLIIVLAAINGLSMRAGIFIWAVQNIFAVILFPLRKITVSSEMDTVGLRWVWMLAQSLLIGVISNIIAVQLLLAGNLDIFSFIILVTLGGVLSFIYRCSGEFQKFFFKEELDYLFNRFSRYLSKNYVSEKERREKIFPDRDF